MNLAFYLCLFFSNFCYGVIGFGYFWHISDTHVDQNYSRSGNIDNLCHQDEISYPDAGLFGNFLCDSPEFLINYTIKAMNILHPKPDFIVWTGDNLPHTKSFDPNWPVTYEAIHNTTRALAQAFPGIPILPAIGNHDSFPPDHLSPGGAVYQGYLQEGAWDTLLPPETHNTFSKGGYYSYLLKPGLRIISLNTILWYRPNNNTSSLDDPADQFSWLTQVLANCSQASEKVYIIGHVPPGFYNRVKEGESSDPTYHTAHLIQYVDILNDHAETIVGQFYGHLHMDLFQIFTYGKGDSYRGSSLLASSVTPWHTPDNVSLPVNPSVRLLKFAPDTYRLLDYEQYYLNLSWANAHKEQMNETLYRLLYKFTETYSVPDLSTESLVKVYENLERNTNGTFVAFFNYLTAGKESVTCDETCRMNQLCAMTSSTSKEYFWCTYIPYFNYIAFGCALLFCILVGVGIICFYFKFQTPYQYVQITYKD